MRLGHGAPWYSTFLLRIGDDMAARGRAFQMSILAFLVVVVIGGLSAYAARDNLIRYTLNPGRNFGDGAQPTVPNYAVSSAWAAKQDNPSKPVDVFFIYPTVFFSGEYWNAPISNNSVRERVARAITPLYVTPFSSGANLFMPYYRQAAPYSFMSGSENGREARELAYSDVVRAFHAFIEHHNNGRPFIIAGYGQGALYGVRLLADLNPSERNRLVAAYLLEVAVPLEVLSAMAKGVPLCDSPDQTGCTIAWHSMTQNARGDMPRENALIWRSGGGFDATRGRELACVNPLTWTISGRAGSTDMNLGSATLSEFSPGGVALTRAATSADCWNGLLFTDITPDPIFLWSGPRYRELFPSSINPFYADIKDNVARRIETYLAQASLPEPPPNDENQASDPQPMSAP